MTPWLITTDAFADIQNVLSHRRNLKYKEKGTKRINVFTGRDFNSNLEIQFHTTVRHTSRDFRTRNWIHGSMEAQGVLVWSRCRPGDVHKVSHGECGLRREMTLEQCPGQLQYFNQGSREWFKGGEESRRGDVIEVKQVNISGTKTICYVTCFHNTF